MSGSSPAVSGALAPNSRQRRQYFTRLDEAVALQSLWEAERMGTRSALRPKITRLTQPQLAQAEAAQELLKGTQISVIDAVRHALRSPPPAKSGKKLGKARDAFLADRKGFVGPRQVETFRLTGVQFAKTAGDKTLLAEIGTEQVRAWLTSKGDLSKKS